MIIEIRAASRTAPALLLSRRDGGWRFARKQQIRRISAELFCANDNLNCYGVLKKQNRYCPAAAAAYLEPELRIYKNETEAKLPGHGV
jgi:hypothetical protein